MLYNEHAYYIILRRKSRGNEVLYSVGGEGGITTVLRLSGKNAGRGYKRSVEALAKQGAAIPLRVSSSEQVYSVREDLGPVAGSYLILVRRAKNIEKWGKFFSELLDGHYAGVAKAFSTFLEMAMELSKIISSKKYSRDYAISSVVADALSSALKQFVNKITSSVNSSSSSGL